jgi:hypothetical protein
VSLEQVERLLHALFIDAPGTGLRDEDRTKSIEVAALLGELARVSRKGTVVDVAAGKSAVGLLAVELLGFEHLVVLERDPKRLAHCRHGVARLTRPARVELREGDLGDGALWPEKPGAVVALHACGKASDAVIDAAIAHEAKWLLLVPCCTSPEVPAWAVAEARAKDLGIPSHAAVRTRFLEAFIDAERVLRLEAAGWETTVVPFVAPTVTPRNQLFRARRLQEPKRMEAARLERERLLRTLTD